MNSAMRSRIVSQAAFTAMPLRSVPEEAAVAEVLGTLPVSVAVILTLSMPTPNRAGGDLRDLLEQALSHLGPAVVHVDRPVLVDVDERARLVEVGER